MKELEPKIEEKLEVHAEQQQEKKTVFVGTARPQPGHKCFEYDVIKNELRLAQFKESYISFEEAQKGRVAPKRNVMIQPGCFYVTALNAKNAIKHLSKNLKRKIAPIILTNTPLHDNK